MCIRDSITGVNNKDTQEIINDNKPIIIIEHANKNPEPLDEELKETSNTETPEVDNTADNTVRNQLEQMEEIQQQKNIPQQKKDENYEEQMVWIFEKYAKAIKELRKERDQLME